MENNDRQAAGQTANTAVPQAPRSYNFLLRLSRRLGTVATKSSFVHDVKEFMHQEITLTPSDHLFGSGFPRIAFERPQEQQKERGKGSGAEKRPTGSSHDSAADKEQKKVNDLKKIVKLSHEVLMTANTVFPITLFPDTVTVDRTKITITRRDFFWSADVLSIRIEDVLNVSATVGPLFGSLTIASRVMSTTDHFVIRHLWRNDAIRLKHIIQGYVIAQHNKIDTAHLNTKELVDTLIELGHDSNR